MAILASHQIATFHSEMQLTKSNCIACTEVLSQTAWILMFSFTGVCHLYMCKST